MAIVNTIQRLMNGYGNGTCYVPSAGNALVSGANTITITLANSGFTQGYTNGLIRVHAYGGGGTSPSATAAVSVGDGTNTVYVLPTTVTQLLSSSAAGSGIDLLVDVNVDIQISVVTVVITLSGTSPTGSADIEVCLNP